MVNHNRARFGGLQDTDASLPQCCEHRRMRMPETIAVTGRNQRKARRHRIDERRGRGASAAVMGQHQGIGLSHATQRQQLVLDPLRDIPRDQRRTCRAVDVQDAGPVVIVRYVGAARRMQEGELDTVQGPLLSHFAWSEIWTGYGGLPSERHPDRQGLAQGVDTARMIEIGMTHHQHIDLLPTAPRKPGQDHTTSEIPACAKARPGVVDEHVSCGLHGYRKSLADIEHRELEFTR